MRISRILSSPFYPLFGATKMAVAVILVMIGVDLDMFEQINVSDLSIPDDYLPFMLVSSIVMGCLFIRAASLKWYRQGADIDNGEKEDKKYKFCTFLSIVLGIAIGMYGAVPVTDSIFIGAGLWTYTAVAGILSALAGIMVNYAFQYGVREMIIKSAETAKRLQNALKEAEDKLKE